MESLDLFARMFVIGIAVAAPVGAMGVLCIQRTLDGGWRAGMATGLGIASADALYAGLAAFGVAAVSATLIALQTPLRLVGGAVLVYVGVRSMFPTTAGCEPAAATPSSHGSRFATAFALTLTNPMTIMAFGAIFASAGLTVAPTAGSAAIATLGVAIGSLSWWLVLVTGVSVVRHGVGPRLVTWVRRFSGAVIVAFGVAAIASVLVGALSR